mmetsp:Transcript_18745/g.43781  ORF Transcript_18745/g.43781 Transcript_18745/m.43781 type:complete len:141 (-) Transcript_18745:40-462(-)
MAYTWLAALLMLQYLPLARAEANQTQVPANQSETQDQQQASRRLRNNIQVKATSDQACWISRHSLWDCGLDCYDDSTFEWRPCASRCVQLQGLDAHCNYCLAELVHCVLLQCVSPCAVSTHSKSCEKCILDGCNDPCWNP